MTVRPGMTAADIVRRLAAMDPMIGVGDTYRCRMCGAPKHWDHSPDCTWLAAKRWAEENA